MRLRRFAQSALGVPFIVLGTQTVTHPHPRLNAAHNLRLPVPRVLVPLTGVAMVAGGLGLIFNRLPRTAAVGLATSLIPTTLGQHRFWVLPTGQARQEKLVNFVKNIGLIGGLITVVTATPKHSENPACSEKQKKG
ncbi:MAG TPA: DoxX family protein [Beutenbergiaceae bacterium]|nr:DoxX family protein [Beutenbergiaceae bacterium]